MKGKEEKSRKKELCYRFVMLRLRGSISYQWGDGGLRKQKPEISLSSFVIKEIFYNFVARFGLCTLSVNLVTFKSPRSLSCPLASTSLYFSLTKKKLLFYFFIVVVVFFYPSFSVYMCSSFLVDNKKKEEISCSLPWRKTSCI